MLARVLDGRYELSGEIGRGSTGSVWEAWDPLLATVVAVKIFDPRLLARPHARRRFVREVEAARALRHEHLVEVLGHGVTDDGGAYLVMERLIGTGLAARLRADGPLDQLRAIRITTQILEGILVAHRRGVVHRDLKPGNIMLIRRGSDLDFVKVCDFGLAKAMDRDSFDPPGNGLLLDLGSVTTGDGIVCGTPEYMAPEQARGDAIDARTDLYALSVMLFVAVVGQLPFSGRSALAVISQHLTAAPPRPSELRPDLGIFPPLERLILRGLSKDPAERPSSAEVFHADLLQIGRDYARWRERRTTSNVVVEVPTLTDAAPRPTRPAWAFAFVAFTVAAGTVGAGMWSRSGASPASRSPSSSATERTMTSSSSIATPTPLPAPSGTPAATVASLSPPSERDPAPTKRTKPGKHIAKTPLDRAYAALGNGHIDEACALGEQASRDPGASPQVFRFLGRCFMRLGAREKGIAYYRRYLELSPSSPDAVFIREMVR